VGEKEIAVSEAMIVAGLAALYDWAEAKREGRPRPEGALVTEIFSAMRRLEENLSGSPLLLQDGS
jgi:hypothetical protein